MILLGVFCRIGGALVAINMLFAIGLVRMGAFAALDAHGGWAIQPELFFLLSGVAVMFLGSGRYALRRDRLLPSARRSAESG